MALLDLKLHCETTAKYRVSTLGSTSTYIRITNLGGAIRQNDGPITVHFNGTSQTLPPPTVVSGGGSTTMYHQSIVIVATGDVEIEGLAQTAHVTVVVPD